VRRFVRSEGYARARLVSGAFFIVFGIAIALRTAAIAGFSAAALPAYVLGAAMLALGGLRFREYFAARNRP
jgi:uncharacterized integral membrane protein